MPRRIEFGEAYHRRFWIEHEYPHARPNGPHEYRAACRAHSSHNDTTLQINLISGVATCHGDCGRSWTMKEWEERHLSPAAAWQSVLLKTGYAGAHSPAWDLPFVRPLTITDIDWQLGFLAEQIHKTETWLNTRPVAADAATSSRSPSDWKAVACYPYPEDRAVKIRLQNNRTGRKFMMWRQLTQQGGWKKPSAIQKDSPRKIALYRQNTLVGAEEIWFLNGEKAVDYAITFTLIATCLPNGEGSWHDQYLEHFRSARIVYVIADNDPKGISAARKVAGALIAGGVNARVVELPGLPPKGDFYDYLLAGGTVERAREIAEGSPAGDPADYAATARNPQPADPGNVPPLASPPANPESVEGPDLTGFASSDTGNAERLIAYAGDTIRYCDGLGCWILWAGTHWTPDRHSGAITRLAIETMRLTRRQADARGDETLWKFAIKSENRSGLNNLLRIAQTMAGIHVRDLDTHHRLIPCLNGCLDVDTGELRPHRKEDYITRLFPHTYDPAAPLPELYLQTLDTLMGGGPDASEGDLDKALRMIDYLQVIYGYCLTGDTSEKVFFVFYGESGNNGKTLMLSTLAAIMGEYAVTIDPLTLTMSHKIGDSNKKSDMARCRGARLVRAPEPPGEENFDQALLKAITLGDDLITAAFKHQDTFEYRFTAKPAIETNRVLGFDDKAFAKRMHIVHHLVEITGDRIDRDLKQKLVAEYNQIFSWMVKGALRWKEEGLQRPVEMAQMIEDFRKENIENDGLGEFLAECFDDGPLHTHSCPLEEVYRLYKDWCVKQKAGPKSLIAFSRHLFARDWIHKQKPSSNHKGAKVRAQGIRPKPKYATAAAAQGKDAQYRDDEYGSTNGNDQ
jgi:putative DNA primase/helicase